MCCCLLQLQQRENSRTENRTHVTEQFHYVQYNISIKRYIRTLYFNAFYIYSIDLQILSSDFNAPLCSMQHVHCPANGSSFTWRGQCCGPCIILCLVVSSHMQYSYIFFIYCIMHYIILSFALYNGLTHLLKAFKFNLSSKIHPIVSNPSNRDERSI